MAKLGITLNEVLRDFIGQVAYTYDKYIEKFDIEKTPVDSFDLMKHFKFDTVDKMNHFIYEEAALEIFGHADQIEENLINQLNEFLIHIKEEEEHDVVIISRGALKAIPGTFFFLSKTGCRADNIKFVTKYEEMWDDVDVLISAHPQTLNAKPDGKISIKIKSTYNEDINADYEMDAIMELLKEPELLDKIIESKLTDYEEI